MDNLDIKTQHDGPRPKNEESSSREVYMGATTMFRPNKKHYDELMTIRAKNDKKIELHNLKRPSGSTNVLGTTSVETGTSRLLTKPKTKMTLAYEKQEAQKQLAILDEIERQKLIFSTKPKPTSKTSLSKEELRIQRLLHFQG